jgi:antibiotic biosynthesis monooxygenase (ABM) superfamily enzyme
MIVRVWRGWTSAGNAEAYEELLRARILPELRRLPGHRGASVLRRDSADGVEFLVLNRFESLDAVREFAGPDHELAVITPEADALLERSDERALHYEVTVDLD